MSAPTPKPRIFLIGTQRMAEHWRDYIAAAEQIAIWGDPRRIIVASRADRLRGYRFLPGDTVVYLPRWFDIRPQERQPLSEILAYLLSLARSQGIDVAIERAG